MRAWLFFWSLAGCDGAPDDTALPIDDPDGDAHVGEADCDEGNAAVYVGAGETCNGVDDDCDGVVDPDWSADATPWFGDGDGDGYGTAADQVQACEQPAGYADNELDCDDAAASVSPAGVETCNGVDDNCDQVVDPANAEGAAVWHPDSDGDGYGSATASATACAAPAGFLGDGTDCDDGDALVNPAATELCNEVDDNCDGEIDGDATGGGTAWYPDTDLDGYGDPAGEVSACVAPEGYVGEGGDCDDGDTFVSPAALDVPDDGVDQDCYGGDLVCADVELRSALGVVVASGTTEGAGDEDDLECGVGEEVLFHWEAPADGRYTFSPGGAAALAVYGGVCSLTDLACSADGQGAINLVAGEELTLRIEGESTAYALGIDREDEADCEDGVDGDDGLVDCLDPECAAYAACDISRADLDLGSALGDQIVVGDTAGEGDEWYASCGGGESADLVVAWTAPATATYSFSLEGSWYDNLLAAFHPQGPAELLCAKDGSKSGDAAFTLEVRAGSTLLLLVDGEDGAEGVYFLSIN